MNAADLVLPSFSALPRLIVHDLDGTLLAPDSTLRARSRAILDATIARGIPTVVATARPVRSVRALLGTELLEQMDLIQMNGAAFRRVRGAHTALGVLPEAAALEIARISSSMLARTARVVCEIDGEHFGCDASMDAETLWEVNRATAEMVMSVGEAARRGVAKIAINGITEPVAQTVARIRNEFGDIVDVIAEGSGTFANVIPRGVSKHVALQHLLGHPEPWAGTLAFGDDIADLELLSLAEWGVAMSNAHPEVRKAARYRTHSNVDDGVAHVLEALLASLP